MGEPLDFLERLEYLEEKLVLLVATADEALAEVRDLHRSVLASSSEALAPAASVAAPDGSPEAPAADAEIPSGGLAGAPGLESARGGPPPEPRRRLYVVRAGVSPGVEGIYTGYSAYCAAVVTPRALAGWSGRGRIPFADGTESQAFWTQREAEV